MTAYPDMAQMLLHELGHTLGLHHSNTTKESCESSGTIHGGPVTGANGVMQTALPANFAAFRAWRRDDLEGLDYLYSGAANSYEIAWWEDTQYPDYPSDSLAQSMTGMEVSRSVALSNRTSSTLQALATTAPDGRVLHRLMDETGALITPLADAVVDPSPSGITWAMPAVAIGVKESDARVFVAWMANELADTNQLTHRVALRSVAGGDWSYADHPDVFRVNRLAAGIVQAGEACDDGNEVIGDGCDACAATSGDDPDGGGKGNDEVGDSDELGGESESACECRARSGGGAAWATLLVVMLGALGLRRRGASSLRLARARPAGV